MKDKTVGIFTLGCRVNLYESCAIAERLQESGFEIVKEGKADYTIVNTCAVTAESERKSRQLVRRCASYSKVLVTGCAAQLKDSFSNIENVIFVCGNRKKSAVADALLNHYKGNAFSKTELCGMEDAPFEELKLSGENKLFSTCRAFVKIQDGCNGKCTYCIIPKCRGRVRSRLPEDIINEAESLVKKGYSELILTGIEVSAYNKISLADLVVKISKIQGIRRIRLGSLSPNIITDSFLQKVSSLPNFMPHIHLSLQSCCDKTLKAMARPYKKSDIIKRVEAIRRYIPNCIITADIIVGFPSETEDDFIETLDTLKDLKLFHIHSFPYSEREGTPAAEMPGSVPKSVRAERNNRLIKQCGKIRNLLLDEYIGKTVNVLVEKKLGDFAFGHTEDFIEAKISSYFLNVGDYAKVKVISHDGTLLQCVIFEDEEQK